MCVCARVWGYSPAPCGLLWEAHLGPPMIHPTPETPPLTNTTQTPNRSLTVTSPQNFKSTGISIQWSAAFGWCVDIKGMLTRGPPGPLQSCGRWGNKRPRWDLLCATPWSMALNDFIGHNLVRISISWGLWRFLSGFVRGCQGGGLMSRLWPPCRRVLGLVSIHQSGQYRVDSGPGLLQLIIGGPTTLKRGHPHGYDRLIYVLYCPLLVKINYMIKTAPTNSHWAKYHLNGLREFLLSEFT